MHTRSCTPRPLRGGSGIPHRLTTSGFPTLLIDRGTRARSISLALLSPPEAFYTPPHTRPARSFSELVPRLYICTAQSPLDLFYFICLEGGAQGGPGFLQTPGMNGSRMVLSTTPRLKEATTKRPTQMEKRSHGRTARVFAEVKVRPP